ncbi:MAG: MFS transporter [Gammaproteobacteria bacterium]|nr:MFS transporter [Gammaproteobacteria bacterium]
MHIDKMSGKEWQATLSLAAIYSARMLGLFMILPVFSIYAATLRGTTPFLIGLALGIYGLAQACLQIPFGLASDFLGRKRIILIGLCLFAIGSIVAALSHTITGVILGRAIQGTGAIGSTLTALLADLTREQHRAKSMSAISVTIALSFSLAIMLGPLLDVFISVSGIFWVSAGLAIASIVVLWLFVPAVQRTLFHSDTELSPVHIYEIIRNKELLLQNLSIFMLNAILTSTFIAIPIAITRIVNFSIEYHGLIYLAALMPAFLFMIPFVIIAEKKQRIKQIYLLAIFTILMTQILLLIWEHSYLFMSISLFCFFTALIVLEALIPSLISKIAPAGCKGTALGVYSTAQFFGMFIGGTIGGTFLHFHDITGVFLFGAILSALWLLIALTMKEPRYVSSYIMHIGPMHKSDAIRLQTQLRSAPGVIEAVVDYQSEVAYLKIDRKIVKFEDLQSITVSIHR